jgi:methylglutaconyl-CoA hydratase
VVKKLVADMAEVPLNEEAVTESARRMAEIRTMPEAQEGLSAFLEKRKPQWAATA